MYDCEDVCLVEDLLIHGEQSDWLSTWRENIEVASRVTNEAKLFI